MTEAIKRCGGCGLEKPVGDYFKRADRPGYRSTCKDCFSAKRRARRQRDPEKTRQETADYRQRNPDRVAEWTRRRDPAKVRQSSAAYRARRADEIAVRRRAAYWANVELERERARLKMWKRRVQPDSEAFDYIQILAADPCAYCGAPSISIDHIEPVDAGGSNDWGNFTAACIRCNSSKRETPLLLYLIRC